MVDHVMKLQTVYKLLLEVDARLMQAWVFLFFKQNLLLTLFLGTSYFLPSFTFFLLNLVGPAQCLCFASLFHYLGWLLSPLLQLKGFLP